MNLYIVNGFPCAGKDTFVHYCTRNLNYNLKYVFSLSTVAPIKSMLYQYGWDGEKTPKIRKIISEIKKSISEEKYIEIYINNFINNIRSKNNSVIFIFSREPEEILFLKNKYKAKTIFIKRNAINFTKISNDSDRNVEDFNYDYYIDNNGTFYELNNQVKKFLKEEKLI